MEERRSIITPFSVSSHEIPVPSRVSEGSCVSSLKQYKELYEQSVQDPDKFWGDRAREELSWFAEFDQVKSGNFSRGDIAWFLNGKLNACYNCVDRHLKSRRKQVAIIAEGDEPGFSKSITYEELHFEVCRYANLFKSLGVQKGTPVALYLPMVPETLFCMLACARIGAPHLVVFAGYSSDSLRDRINEANCHVLVTADEGKRGGKLIPLKITADRAVAQCPCIEKVVVMKRTGGEVPFIKDRDLWLEDNLKRMRPYCPIEWMDSEDVLFYLYTSGASDASPRGIVHSTGGYLLQCALTHRHVFGWQEGDVFACMADLGWITGHSYILYGPLCNGATTVVFESTPMYPDAGRYWDVVQRLRITQLYTAPTALRVVMKRGNSPVEKYDLTSLRVLGSVGEPMSPDVWQWYYEVVGRGVCAVVNTWWQTETGGVMLGGAAGATPMKPSSCSVPFYGVCPVLLDERGQEVTGDEVSGVLALKTATPGLARTIHNDHERFLQTYTVPYPGYFFTGDGCHRDRDGYYWITGAEISAVMGAETSVEMGAETSVEMMVELTQPGRVDEVVNVAGHRLGTAEIEMALIRHDACLEAAVVTIPHDWKGEGFIAFCLLRPEVEPSSDLIKELRLMVKTHIGGFAMPDSLIPVTALPKTRTGKIMRRLLRRMARGEEIGDTAAAIVDKSIMPDLAASLSVLSRK